MDYLKVGTIVRTLGLNGEVKVYPSSDFRDIRFKKGNKLFLFDEEKSTCQELKISSQKSVGQMEILGFDGVFDINDAEKLVGFSLFVQKDRSFLSENSYFHEDLIGLKVYFENNDFIGTVKDIEDYCSYKTLRIARENDKDVLIPFLKVFIEKVDLDAKSITVKYLKGLV